MNVRDVINRGETGLVRGLSLQIITVVNAIAPNSLVRLDDLRVNVEGNQINPFMQSAAKISLQIALRERGTTLVVNSAYRTVVQQYLLRKQFERGLFGITAAAVPGSSNHESGLALDIEDPDGWQPYFQRHNWIRLGRDFDFPHYDYVFPATTRLDLGRVGVRAFQRLWNQFHPRDRIPEDGVYGPQTEMRLASSPVNGFLPPFQRSLQLQEPRLQGEDVAAVQRALLQSAIVQVNLNVTGSFDRATERAIRQFQQATGRLAVDGIVGPTTLRELGLLR
jgi:N-acetylmuramoyl-L-alanine amidase